MLEEATGRPSGDLFADLARGAGLAQTGLDPSRRPGLVASALRDALGTGSTR